MDPENPLALFVLTISETAHGQTGSRAFLYMDDDAAHRAGEKMRQEKPSEVVLFSYKILPLEGPIA